jgi:DNA-binding MarR family transcriptional regulator
MQPTDRESMIAAIFAAQMQILRQGHDSEMASWLHLDLTIAQVKTLMVLAAGPPVTASQLAAHLGLGRPATSILIDRLVRDGLVARAEDSEDRRRVLVTLTPAGDDLTTRLRQGSRERLERLLRQMTSADLAALRQGMEALAAAAAHEAEDTRVPVAAKVVES